MTVTGALFIAGGVFEAALLLASMAFAWIWGTYRPAPWAVIALLIVGAAAAAATAGESGTKDLATMVDLAASAAQEAARGTAEMLCRVGRASRLGNRVLGHPDPGATSFAVILRAMHDWITSPAALGTET